MEKKKKESWKNYFCSFDFWKQIALMILVFIILISATFISLRFFTHHGQKIKVPDMNGYRIDELKDLEEKYAFKFVIRDSVFDADSKPGTIIGQTPKAGSIVKKRRTFYVVLSAYGQASIKMPNLIDLSYRQAVSLLETYGLKVGRIINIPSIANGAVLGQLYNGLPIAYDSPIPQGSVIDLEVGSSSSNIIMKVDSATTEMGTEESPDIQLEEDFNID